MGTALEAYKKRLKDSAESAASGEQTAGNFFTTRGGILSLGEEELPGNEMLVVIVDSVHEKTYYPGKFNPDLVLPPKCFSFGRIEKDMQPHENVPDPDDEEAEDSYFELQSEFCDECPHGEWGSADTGRGKACGDRRRLAVIPAGRFVQSGKKKTDTEMEVFSDPDHFKDAEIAFLKVPVTSVKAYGKYVHMLNRDHQLPPFAVLTHVYLEPHPTKQFEINFDFIEAVEDPDILEILFARNKEASDVIEQPYNEPTDEEMEKPKAKGRTGLSGLRKKKRAK